MAKSNNKQYLTNLLEAHGEMARMVESSKLEMVSKDLKVLLQEYKNQIIEESKKYFKLTQ